MLVIRFLKLGGPSLTGKPHFMDWSKRRKSPEHSALTTPHSLTENVMRSPGSSYSFCNLPALKSNRELELFFLQLTLSGILVSGMYCYLIFHSCNNILSPKATCRIKKNSSGQGSKSLSIHYSAEKEKKKAGMIIWEITSQLHTRNRVWTLSRWGYKLSSLGLILYFCSKAT